MKKKTAYEKHEEEWDKKNAWIDAILLAYDYNIKYDYPIPPASRVRKVVRKIVDEIDVPKAFRDNIRGLVFSSRSSYSPLEGYLSDYTHRFRHEFFTGYGTLVTWRDGERENAEKRVEKCISTRDKNNFKRLRDAIRITEEIKPFEMEKVLGI